jgi:hypothetical protein
MSKRRTKARTAQQDPRQHHIVPVFYLAGFTPTLSPDGSIWVFRYNDAARYRTSPRKACRQRDYYRVASDGGVDEHYMERTLASHEGVVAPFVRQLAADGRVTDRKQVAEAISLAAVLIGRRRVGRSTLEMTLATNVVKALRSETVTPDEWDRYRAHQLANGAAPDECPEYETRSSVDALTELLDAIGDGAGGDTPALAAR